MRCNICDRQLTEKEISWNKEIEAFEPCTVCLDVINDAAYSDGFQNIDDDSNTILVGEESNDDMIDTIPFSDLKYYGRVLKNE